MILDNTSAVAERCGSIARVVTYSLTSLQNANRLHEALVEYEEVRGAVGKVHDCTIHHISQLRW